MNFDTVMIEVKPGDKVENKHNHRIGHVEAIKLVPNSIAEPDLIAQLCVIYSDGRRGVATANHFLIVKGEEYNEMYPSKLLDWSPKYCIDKGSAFNSEDWLVRDIISLDMIALCTNEEDARRVCDALNETERSKIMRKV